MVERPRKDVSDGGVGVRQPGDPRVQLSVHKHL